MSGMIGMDINDVRQRAAILNAQAAELARVEAALRRAFEGSTWRGHDADWAKTQLESDVIPALRVVQQFVERTGSLMVQNASQQEAASA